MCSKRKTVKDEERVPVNRPVVDQWEATGATLRFSSSNLSTEDVAALEVTNWHTSTYTLAEVAEGLSFNHDNHFEEYRWEICEGTIYRTHYEWPAEYKATLPLGDGTRITTTRVPVCDVSLSDAFFDSDEYGTANKIRTRFLVESCCYFCKHCSEQSEPYCDGDDGWNY